MTTNKEWLERFQQTFTPNYRPAELVVERGEGVHVFDVEGRKYLDMASGIAVSALGHGHPALISAIERQVKKVLHTSNLYLNMPEVELAERLCRCSFAEAVYFSNSGAEANEAAIKLARRYAYKRGEKDRNRIVSFERSFHGRTFAALTATAQPKYHEGFGPMPEGFDYVPYGDVAAIEAAVDERTAAVIAEPLQGEGGVRVPPKGFLAELRRITAAKGALLIFDEVQVGVGRTGAMFCHEHEGVTPDVMTLAKGIAGGLPLGAMVTTKEAGAALEFGTHATTYGGNPVACAAGSAVLDVLSGPGFFERMNGVAAELRSGLEALKVKHPVISEVRGRGFLLGAELVPGAPFAAADVVRACRERGVLVHVAGPSVVRLAPPLILGSEDASRALAVLDEAFAAAA